MARIFDILIGVLLVTLMMTGFTVLFNNTDPIYPDTNLTDTDLSKLMVNTTDITGEVLTPTQENVESEGGEFNEQSEESEGLLRAGAKSVKLLFKTSGFAKDMVFSGSGMLESSTGLDSIVADIVYAIIFVFIVAGILYYIFKVRG